MSLRTISKRLLAANVILVLALAGNAGAQPNPFVGDWALTIPSGGAGWLGIKDEGGTLKGSILWGGGSVVPVASVKVDGDTLVVTREHRNRQRNAEGKNVNATTVETITAKLEAGELKLTTIKKKPDGTEGERGTFTGRRMPPLPPRPDLAKVKFGERIELFNGKDLAGWRLIERNAANGWSVKDGVLSNNPAQTPGQPNKHYGNLRTEKEFEDFNLKTEVSVPARGNSGIYLRGIYEVQVSDTFGRPVNSHNMAGIYSRITPTEAAEKRAGEWQTLDITLVDRHVTVILNGQKVIDNQPIMGCTGGALWSDVSRPGPIYLQGDHSGVSYRNMVLRPVLKQ
jgi:hypothetical protein